MGSVTAKSSAGWGSLLLCGLRAVPDPAGATSTRLLSVVRPAFVVIAVIFGFSPHGEMMFVVAADVRAGCARRRHLPPSAHR